MLTKTKIALAAALILGTASAAMAGNDESTYGGPVQTWQDIEHARQDIQNQIRKQYHTGNASSAYGYVVVPKHKLDASR
jgi:hypothetical protein